MNKEENYIGIQNFHFHYRPTLIVIITLLINSLQLFTQVSPLYSNYYNYEQFINPAITGRDKSPIVNLSHKQYFFGVEGSPYTTCLGASMRLGTFDFYNPRMMLNRSKFFSRGRMGFGAMFIQDKDGPLNSYFGELSYAYFIPVNHDYSELSFGLSAQIMHYSINRDLLHPDDVSDPEYLNLNNSKIVPESGCGVYYHDLQFYIGASVNDLFLSKLPYSNDTVTPNKRDYFFQTGYKFFLTRFEMEPSLYLAQIDEKPLYYYGQLKFYYMNYNWFAIGYKSTKSLLVSLGINIRRFYFAYAFEQNVSYMGSYFNGSHEIMIGMNIGLYEPQGLRKRVGGTF